MWVLLWVVSNVCRRAGMEFFSQEFPVVRGLVCVLTWIACLWCVLRTTECDNEDVIRVRK